MPLPSEPVSVYDSTSTGSKGASHHDTILTGHFREAITGYPNGVNIFILIMGRTGVGKSKFINDILEGEYSKSPDKPTLMTVQQTLNGCTTNVEEAAFLEDQSGRRVILVDTPGYDGRPYNENHDFLETIAVWLKKNYETKNTFLGGIIYLHDISQDRISSDDKQYFDVFKALCGSSSFNRVFIVMTKWDRVEQRTSDEKWKDLQHFFHSVTTYGAYLDWEERNSKASSKDIVIRVLSTRQSSAVLRIQLEMVNSQKTFEQTDAAIRYAYYQAQQIDIELLSTSLDGDRKKILLQETVTPTP